MKLLFVGDVVGSPGRDMVKEYLPKIKENIDRKLPLLMGKMLLVVAELPRRYTGNSLKLELGCDAW